MILLDRLVRRIIQVFIRSQFNPDKRCRFYRELIVLMDTGFSRSEVIDAIWRIKTRDGADTNDPVGRILASLRTGLRNGQDLGVALQPWIPRAEHMAITAIETSDQFSRNLESHCQMLEMNQGIRSDVLSILAYPLLLLVMTYGMLVYFAAGIAPQLDPLLPIEHWTGIARTVTRTGAVLGTWMPLVALVALLAPLSLHILLPRWTGAGRRQADRLPIFAMYRLRSGVMLLQSIACLAAAGLTPVEALTRLRPAASAYLASHIDQIHYQMLNGANLGLAMQHTAGGWPDRELVLTLRILSRSQDFPQHLRMIAGQWMTASQDRILRNLSLIRASLFLIVFGIITATVAAMYELQGQITTAY